MKDYQKRVDIEASRPNAKKSPRNIEVPKIFVLQLNNFQKAPFVIKEFEQKFYMTALMLRKLLTF